MHVMIATDGHLQIDKTVAIAGQLAGADGQVTVYTVIEMPRGLLADMRASMTDTAGEKERQMGVEYRKTQAGDAPVTHWPGDDAFVASYVKRKAKAHTGDLEAALSAAGVAHTVVVEEGENTARSIIDAAKSNSADVLCIGTHGLGRFEGLLGSASTKLARHSPCSVVLVR